MAGWRPDRVESNPVTREIAGLPDDRRGSGNRPLAVAFVVAVMVATVLPPIPVTDVLPTDDASTPCACGCGEVKGYCCCVAPRASGLALRCSQRTDPVEPMGGADGGKFIGPPAVVDLIRPEPTPSEPGGPEGLFAGPDLRPETPPPRA